MRPAVTCACIGLTLASSPYLCWSTVCGVLIGIVGRYAADTSRCIPCVISVLAMWAAQTPNYLRMRHAFGAVIGFGVRTSDRARGFDEAFVVLGHTLLVAFERCGSGRRSSICDLIGALNLSDYQWFLYAGFIARMSLDHIRGPFLSGRLSAWMLVVLHIIPTETHKTGHALAFASFVLLSMTYATQTVRTRTPDRITLALMYACLLLGHEAWRNSEGLLLLTYEVYWVLLLAWYMRERSTR